jgi:5-methylcytosine-specific restriction enzyme A
MRLLTKIRDLLTGRVPLGAKRSGSWTRVRAIHIEQHPTCAVCGGKDKLEVHHIVPFHINPGLELIPDNLVTLCESKKHGLNCHLFVGHMGNYQNVNPNLAEMAKYLNERMIEARRILEHNVEEEKKEEPDASE